MEERENETKEISLRDLQKAFLRCWWIMLAVAVLVAGTTYLFLHVTHKDAYSAKAKIWVMRENTGVQDNDKDANIKSTADVSIANNIRNDVVDAAKNNYDVREAVWAETGISIQSSMLRVSSNEDSHVVEISVTCETPEEAYTLANSLMRQTCKKINELMEGDYTKPYDSVEMPTKPSNTISKVSVLLAGLVGAFVVYVVFFILHLVNDKINSADDVYAHLGISVLGEIPNRRDVSIRKKRYDSYYQSYNELIDQREVPQNENR